MVKRRGHGEGSVYQRKDGRFVASFIVEETGKRKYLYGDTRKEVLDKLQKALYEQKQGILASGPQQTLKTYLEYWLEDVHRLKIREGSYVMYRIILDKHLIPALGHTQLQKLTVRQVQSLYAKKLQEGLSPGRVRDIHAVLRKSLEHAVRTNLVARNVCDLAELPAEKQHLVRALTPEQARKLLQAVRDHHLEALLTLALTTGMRRGELLGLRWQDIDFQQGSLHISRAVSYITSHGFKFVEGEPKTPMSRRKIMLPNFVTEILKRHQISQREMRHRAGPTWTENQLVFCNPSGGYIAPPTLRKHFGQVLKEAGLPHMRFHDLRHSAATLLLSMGVNPKVVQEILGHSTISMTLDVYSHTLPSMQTEAMSKMNDLLQQADDDKSGNQPG